MAHPKSDTDIQKEFDSIAAHGVTHLVSLLEAEEAASLGLASEQALCEERYMTYINYPIPDLTLPVSVDEFLSLAKHLYTLCLAGHHIVVHCRAGIGRTGMTCAAVLMHKEPNAQTAIDHIALQRGVSIPDTEEQTKFIHRLQPLIEKTC